METDPNKTSKKDKMQSRKVTESEQTSNKEPRIPASQIVGSPKQSMFIVSPNIRSDLQFQTQSDPKTSRTNAIQFKKPVMTSRETLKRLLLQREEARRKKVKHVRPKPQNLSLIQEVSREYHQSSQESGFISDLSLDESCSESQGSSDWSDDDKMNKGKQKSFQAEENLDKTVLMSKKKAPRPPIQATKVLPKANEQSEMLAEFLEMYPFQTIFQLYEQGVISQQNYKKLLEMRKEKTQTVKLNKYISNLEKVNQSADIIIKKYAHLYQKLSQDVSATELKHQQLVQIYNSKKNQQKSSVNPFDPERMKFELKLIEKSSEVKAKKQLLQNLQKCLDQFRNKYNENLARLYEQKRQKQNFSQNLIFREIKDFLKLGHQIYNSIIRSLMKNSEIGMSAITKKARQYYIEKLSQKYAPELKQIDEMAIKKLLEHVQAIRDECDKLSEKDFQQITKNVSAQVAQGLCNTVELLHQNITWIRMIRENGELKPGKIYSHAIEIIQLEQPTDLTIEEFSEKFLIQNFKFYTKKVFKRLINQFQPMQSLHYLLQSNKEKRHLKAQKEKLNRLKSSIQLFEKQAFAIDTALGHFKNSEKKFGKLRAHLVQKLKNTHTISQKLASLMKEEETKHIYKSFIPKKRVSTFNFSKSEDESLTQQTKSTKSSWLEIFSQIKRNNLKTPDTHKQIPEISRQNIQSFSNLSYDPNTEQNQQNFSKSMEKIFQKQSFKQQDEESRKRHLDKVCELIIKKQVICQDYEVKKKEEIYQPQHESIFETLFDSVQLTGWKPPVDECFLHLNIYPKRSATYKSVSKRVLPSPKPQQNYSSLNKPQSSQEIQTACQLFIRQFYKNPHILEQLALDNHQLSFLISPEYRKQFIEKKLKDHQLEEKILHIIRLNTHPFKHDPNPIKYMMHFDPDFQQKIQEYQQKIIKNQSCIDPSKITHDFDDISTNADTEGFELIDQKIKQMEESRFWDYHSHRHSEYMKRDLDFDWDQVFVDF